ncbi:hypothetical protein [Citrobacter sp. Cpo040]|uniref:hypothetical protein n=1 Tax=Citrobacter sp. Cpo040 TaxID=2985126 RepID=UPI002576C5B0|nr:hypothetical protein [Citrobacter sp. Cpo040]MDM2876346.1 hypothetical protein [Citrobacter sp. Cpo040]
MYEALFRGLSVILGQYVNWGVVGHWLLWIVGVIAGLAIALIILSAVFKIVSYPFIQMKRKNDLLEEMIREMKNKQ